jgi:hypothetical protein
MAGEELFTVRGSILTSSSWFTLDMDISSTGIDWEAIENIAREIDQEKKKDNTGMIKNLPVKGILRIRSDFFKYRQFKWEPFHADVSLDGDSVSVQAKQAALCGVSTTGNVRITDHGAKLDVNLSAKNLQFRPTVLCLSDKNADVTGTFEAEADLKAEGTIDTIAESLHGTFYISAKDGKIYKSRSLDKTLDTLNETENFRGKLPDLDKEIISYRVFTARGTLEKNILEVDESILDASVFGILARGQVDLRNQSLDLNALVAPVSFVQRIVSKIPILGYILGGNLVSVPVKIYGNINDPKVTFLSPSAVGSELLGIFKRTIKLPVTLIEPVLPGKK